MSGHPRAPARSGPLALDSTGVPASAPRARSVSLDVIRPGLIDISREEGVKESWPSCSLLERAGFRLLVDLAHPKEGPEPLLAALRARGLQPADIHAVLFTHLHPDHIGHKDLFSHALFIFHRAERLAFYFREDRTLSLGGSALLDLHPEGFARPRPSEEWPPLRALGRHVYVRHFPGHTPGSLVVFACAGNRVHALAGDIILNRESHERATPPGSSWKPELIPEQMALIADHADVIVPGHGAAFECRRAPTGAARGLVAERSGPGRPSLEEKC